MDDKNLKIIRYLAGTMFIGSVFPWLVSVIFPESNAFLFMPILSIVAWSLMAFAMFGKFYPLLTVGSIMQALYWVIFIFTGGKFYYKIFAVIAYILLAVAVFQRKNATVIGIIGALLRMLSWVVYLAVDSGWPYGQVDIRTALCDMVGILLACMVLQNTPQIQTVKIKQPTIEQKTDNRIEELTKLKDLLDTGVISQEEFDAKKKQILGV